MGEVAGEEDVFALGATVAKRFRDRPCELEEPLGLRRDAQRSARPRRSGPEPLNESCTDRVRGDLELCERLCPEFTGLSDQAEDEVLGPDIVMPQLARLLGRDGQNVGGGSAEPERRLTRRRFSERCESLVRGLLARPERAADLSPARPARPGRVDELVEQFIATGA